MKWTLVLAALAAAAALADYGLTRSDEETPEGAIYGLAHDLEHADVDGVCERLFPSRALPAAAARTLDLDVGRAGSTWDVEHQRCLRDRGRVGDLKTLDFEEPRVRSVRRLQVEPQQGVTAAATALTSLGGEAPTTVKLVEFREKWRVVVEAR